MKIGYDKNGTELQIGDICKFKIKDIAYEGIVVYDSTEFAFMFEMLSESFPIVFMHIADFGTIEKIVNVWSTKTDDEQYKGYQILIGGKLVFK